MIWKQLLGGREWDAGRPATELMAGSQPAVECLCAGAAGATMGIWPFLSDGPSSHS